MLNSANLSFALCPLLTDGAIEALLTAGSPAQQALYLPKMISGEWTGTMNLTEPQAGSDLALVRTRAEPQPDGTFKLFGTKIYITYGEHDMASNIVHLVLARVSGAPEGVKGISLFIVPKFLVDADGTPGARNDVHCVSIEHKLGIKASPTAVLQFGDHGGAIGQLIGAENRGLESMFIMMNAARYAVGMQGIAIAERAYQQAAAYAKDRVQSRPVDGSTAGSATIIHHPDVRRMLMTMRAYTEGCRAMALTAAAAFDAAHHHPDAEVRQQNQAYYEYMVPLVKGYSTEMSVEVASLGVQVHGGMGFIEETGAAQHLRDARILPIYEGTTAIQANDLVGRKTARDGGRTPKAIALQIAATEAALAQRDSAASKTLARRLKAARVAFEEVVDFVAGQTKASPNAVFAGSVPYLMLAGNVVAGWQLARALIVAEDQLARGEGDAAFLQAKVATARFYGDHLLTKRRGCVTRSSKAQTASPRSRSTRSDPPRRPPADARPPTAVPSTPAHRHLPTRPPMRLPGALATLPLPIIGAPLFIISNPKLVIAQCKAGVVGSMPALNARPAEQLDDWLAEITEALAAHDRAHPERPAAPFAINQIVHKSNDRLDHDMAVCARYKVPIVITSLGARTDVNDAVHAWGGVVMHDIINDFFARKAIEKGADGLIAVAAGAGGHAGVKSPFALIQEIREWFDGPVALSGAIASGGRGAGGAGHGCRLRVHRLGLRRDRGGPGGRRVQTDDRREQLRRHRLQQPLHRRARQLPERVDQGLGPGPGQPAGERPQQDEFRRRRRQGWKDVWGCGQGIGAIKSVQPAAELIARLKREYQSARHRVSIT